MTGAKLVSIGFSKAPNLDVIRGSGIQAGGARSTPWKVAAGEIVWRRYETGIDDHGMQHIFYRQYFVGANGAAAELVGGDIGVHIDSAGVLKYVGGTQFTEFSLGAPPRVAVPQVQGLARAALVKGRPEFELEALTTLTPHELTRREQDTTLALVSDGSGAHFRYAFTAPVHDRFDRPYVVDIDAVDGAFIDLQQNYALGNCSSQNPTAQASATGMPLRSDIANQGIRRSLRASATTDRPAPFVYEGHMEPEYLVPGIEIYQVTDTPSFECTLNVRSKSLFPVQADLAYDDHGDEWHGREAGDSGYWTKIAMYTFRSFGECGWDGSSQGCTGSVAKVSVNITDPFAADGAESIGAAGNIEVPAFSIGVGRKVVSQNGAAPALDVIAHEWGHVMLYSRSIQYGTGVVSQLHEGWGDVFGQSAEKKFQSTGWGAETSTDWTIGEDMGGGYIRSAATDDVTGHTFYGNVYNDTFHSGDEPGITEAHSRGNMLQVALKMMSDGGVNPVCGRLGLGCTSVAGVNFTVASKILYQTFRHYVTASTMTWPQIPNLAAQAAFDYYNRCGYPYPPQDPATGEQNAVAGAFANIGYSRTTAFINCP